MRSIILFLTFILSACGLTQKNDITLFSSEGNEFNLNEVKNNKATVFIFLATECPLSQSYTKTISELAYKFQKEGIKLHAVFPGKEEALDGVRLFKEKYNFKIESLLDQEKELTNFLKATVTPQAFVLNEKAEILYSGRIDNWAESLGVKRQVITSHDLENVLNDIINEKPVSLVTTEPVGCLIE